MSLCIVLPQSREELTFIKRALEWAKTFSEIQTAVLFSEAEFIDYYKSLLNIDVKPLVKEEVSTYVYAIFLASCEGKIDDWAYKCEAKRTYILEKEGAIRRIADLDARDCPNFDSHVFNRLSSRTSQGNFYYFPYGYLFRYPGLGHINSYGFRVPDDYAKLAHRPKNHKLIVFFGGSSTWSMYSLHNEMFQELLQQKLNSWSETQGSQDEYTVLNFGMHGHVVMNSLLTYILFVQKLRPDVVVTNDGWNDFIYGMLSDTFMLENDDLTHQYNLEDWSHLVHNTKHIPGNHVNKTDKAMKIINSPHAIIKAYIRRKLQFHEIVESMGGKFVWGLQPFVGSKLGHSTKELEYTKPLEANNPMHHAYAKIAGLYERYLDTKLPAGVRFANCHAYFKKFDATETLFGDTIHTVPLGDQKIAEFYFEYMLQNFFVESKVHKLEEEPC